MPARPDTRAAGRREAFIVLAALLAGFALGALVRATRPPFGDALVALIAPVGTLWVNGIRMTVVPLVVALLVTGVLSGVGSRALGALGMRSLLVFAAMLFAGGTLAAIVTPPVLARMQLAPEVAEALRASGSAGGESAATTPALPSIAERIVAWLPSNPVRAAADGDMLPLIIFTLLFALAIGRLAPAARDAMLRPAQALADTMLVIVGWILRVAPIGIFALGFALAARTGIGAAGALIWLVALQAAVCLLYTLGVYPAVRVFGGLSFGRFAAAVAPAQSIALSARSSLAALPAQIESATEQLHLPTPVTSFALPFAVSTLRANVPITWVVCVLFLGTLYGVQIAGVALAALVVTSVLASFSVPGIPSGSLFILAPVLVSYGLPPEAVGLLIAVDPVPDMFKTLANVTSHLGSAVLVSRVVPDDAAALTDAEVPAA
ncbi:MAG TPA: cation:dicarboxylase symporter family transporter [Gemmatimonadaceae bacterium]|nr:cation:dicarboxylase symporter family transporter [Gemmatimonadaceae bacterium]